MASVAVSASVREQDVRTHAFTALKIVGLQMQVEERRLQGAMPEVEDRQVA